MTAREAKAYIRRNIRRLQKKEGMTRKQAKIKAINCLRWEYSWGDLVFKGGYQMKEFWKWIEA